MNERIKELAEQSGWSEDIRYAPRAKEIEKFAELIVQDFDNQVIKYQSRVHANGEHLVVERLEQLRTLIKYHFGVEE